jgi:hypothetical protein
MLACPHSRLCTEPSAVRTQDLSPDTTKGTECVVGLESGGPVIVAVRYANYTWATDERRNIRPRLCLLTTLGSTRLMSCISVRLTVSLSPAALALESAP